MLHANRIINIAREERQAWKRTLESYKKMVKRTMFNDDGVEGGKTGYTTKAGGTL